MAIKNTIRVKPGEKIPSDKLAVAAKKKGVIGKRARLAETLSKLRKSSGGSHHLTPIRMG